MLQMVKIILPALISLALCGCRTIDFKGFFMPVSDGVEIRFEQSQAMAPDMHKETINSPQENYTFYVATDPHINQTHKNLDIFNDALRNDAEASFGVILGDCIDIRDNLQKYIDAITYDPERHSFDYKIFSILGNHDTYFNGWADFKANIGPSVYWFDVAFPEGKDLYIALDTATGTLGRKQTEWLRSFLTKNRSSYRHCIILTHTNFFYTDNSQVLSGNMPIEEAFSLIDFLGRQNVSLVLQGHDHFREDLTYDNVRYTVLGAIHDDSPNPEYLKINVTEASIDFDWQLISK